jgi:dynactin complex subunit
LEEENKSLRSEVKDLKANLKINKEIIEGFFNASGKGDKNLFYINKLKEENGKLVNQIESISKERDEIRTKVNFLNKLYYI